MRYGYFRIMPDPFAPPTSDEIDDFVAHAPRYVA